MKSDRIRIIKIKARPTIEIHSQRITSCTSGNNLMVIGSLRKKILLKGLATTLDE